MTETTADERKPPARDSKTITRRYSGV